jgi:hypothetical protein
MFERREISDRSQRIQFVTGGKATFTLVSKSSGQRFTFRVKSADRYDPKSPLYAMVLTGPDNTLSYTYLGSMFANSRAKLSKTKRTREMGESQSFKVLSWFLQNIGSQNVEFWHEGKCGCCGRKLTVPESIETGIGPVCTRRRG